MSRLLKSQPKTHNPYHLFLISQCHRALELAFIFLLVWYYCTLTIRESILKVNGSRIKGWWRLHHFISTVSAGVLLVWPQGETWQLFRLQFVYFNVYISKLHLCLISLSLTNNSKLSRYSPIFTIWLSERFALQIKGTRRTTWYGYHDRRFSFVDVAWIEFLVAFPLWRLHFPSLQRMDSLQTLLTSWSILANSSLEFMFLLVVHR